MRTFWCVLAAAAAVYAADWAYSAANPRFETVHRERFIVIHEKFNKVFYAPAEAHDERCAHALFPHPGDMPCWYLLRHRTELVDLN